jgi:hypothetical protein
MQYEAGCGARPATNPLRTTLQVSGDVPVRSPESDEGEDDPPLNTKILNFKSKSQVRV